FFAAANIRPEFVLRLLVSAMMVRSMTSELMSLANDTPHELGMTGCDPAECEKRRGDSSLSKNVEQSVGVAYHSPRLIVPITAIDDPSEGLDLKIVFDVNGEGIALPKGRAGCKMLRQDR